LLASRPRVMKERESYSVNKWIVDGIFWICLLFLSLIKNQVGLHSE
jgi:hypothetical protein